MNAPAIDLMNFKAESFQQDTEGLVSVFGGPVTNTTKQELYSEAELYDRLMGPPVILPDNTSESKAKGPYFVRGAIEGSRKDENLKTCCTLPIDIDKPDGKRPLPTPEQIHRELRGIFHVVHPTASPGRSRVVFFVDPYHPSDAARLTWAAWHFLRQRGLYFAWAGESKTLSQPWYLPQTTDPEKYQSFGCKGTKFQVDFAGNIPPYREKEECSEKPDQDGEPRNHLEEYIAGLQSGTLHAVTLRWIAIQHLTEKSTRQIFEETTTLIHLHCTDQTKINRWDSTERAAMEKWFAKHGRESGEADKTIEEYEASKNPYQEYFPSAPFTEEELTAASLTPACIVKNYLYADIGTVPAPGGTGKTTLLTYEAICIYLGLPVWGNEVLLPGYTLFVTAEDQRERFAARVREIIYEMGLTGEMRQKAIAAVRVCDVTGAQVRLAMAADGNIVLTPLADKIIEVFRDDPPVQVIFDPAISFGASELAVNDNEQALVTAARRIVNGLNCAVRFICHTGKQVARDMNFDQYASRGGSAFADGSRMVHVLHPWTAEKPGSLKIPPDLDPTEGSSIIVLARAKMSHAPPNLPNIWIRRQGFEFSYVIEQPRAELEAAHKKQNADNLLAFIRAELKLSRRYSKNQLDPGYKDLGMSRAHGRDALNELFISGRLVERTLPADEQRTSRKTYLSPPESCGGV